MPNNVIMRKHDVTTDWQALAPTSVVGTFTISTPPSNDGNVLFESDDDALPAVPWVPGEWHELQHVDLSAIRVKGSTGDIVTVVGGTW